MAVSCRTPMDGSDGRVPDLTLWAAGTPPRPARWSYAETAGLLPAVEVVRQGRIPSLLVIGAA